MQTENTSNRTNMHSEEHDSYGEDIDRMVVVRASEYPSGYMSNSHWHVRGQLVYDCAGVVKVTAKQGVWVVPQHRGFGFRQGWNTIWNLQVHFPCAASTSETNRLQNFPFPVVW